MQNLRKSGGEASGSRFHPSGSGQTTRQESGRVISGEEDHPPSRRDELKDAEAGLGRAKEEYRRLQKEVCLSPIQFLYCSRSLPKLSEATEKIQILSTDNAELLTLQRQDIAAVHDERQQMLKLHRELEDARLENQRLVDKVYLY